MTNFNSEIAPNWTTKTDDNLSQTWLYVVGDSSKPGSYTQIDGYDLCDEGSALLQDNENPHDTALSLVEELGGKVAIVGKVMTEGDEVEAFIIEVLG